MARVFIEELGLTGFGKFQNEILRFGEGLNLIHGSNEAGKSTVQAFITGMLYGFFNPAAKRRTYTSQQARYSPWNGKPYRGYLICQSEGRQYRIERDFGQETLRVLDQVTGEDITSQFPYNPITRLAEPGEKLLGISKTAFNSTANIAQLCCSSMANDNGFAGEVGDKLASMLQTADSGLSVSAAILELDRGLEKVGTTKKSKTPYGVAASAVNKLKEEADSVKLAEEEGLKICLQLNQLRLQRDELEKAKSLLSGKISEGKAKAQKDQYLRAKNILTRIDRLEKEMAGCADFAQVSLENIDFAQEKMGAKAQLLRGLDQTERLILELEKRTAEVNRLYASLELTLAADQTLDQFDQLYERYRNSLPLQEEIKLLQTKQTNLRLNLSRMRELDSFQLEEDIREYDRLEGKKAENGEIPWPAYLLMATGLAVTVAALVLAIKMEVIWAVLALPGVLLSGVGIWLFLRGKELATQSQAVDALQLELLSRYCPAGEEQSRKFLGDLLSKVQLNNYKVVEFREQELLMQQEIEEKVRRYSQVDEEWKQYLLRLTGSKHSCDAFQLKTLGESVKKAKRIRQELQRLSQQADLLLIERENSLAQAEEIDKEIERAVAACSGENTRTQEDLDRCRQGKQKFCDAELELQMQRQLLEQCLGGYSFGELEESVKSANASKVRATALTDPLGQAEQQKIQQDYQEKEAEFNSLAQEIASMEGRQQVLEKTQRPLEEVMLELREAQSLCDAYLLETQALMLAKERITQVAAKLHHSFAPQLNSKVSDLVSFLTNGKYNQVRIDQNLKISLDDKESGKIVELASLSSGTVDLVYMTMRLELASLLRGGGGCPILLDDSFTQLDDNRLESMLRALCGLQSSQVLLFTCHNREQTLLDELGAIYQKIEL